MKGKVARDFAQTCAIDATKTGQFSGEARRLTKPGMDNNVFPYHLTITALSSTERNASMKSVRRTALAALIACAFVSPALAQRDDHFRGDHFRGDIHRFGDHDLGFWRGGSWFHGPHFGRDGWWWIVGDQWYWYPSPVYPYPDPYLPPTVAPAPAATWYYCANPQGYYPYIPQCSVAWQPVPAQ